MRPDGRTRVWPVLLAALWWSAASAATPAWKDLTPAQQAVIAPALKLQGVGFDQLPEARRAVLLTGADRWLAMSEQQRAVATRQLQEWQAMSPAEKRLALEKREQFRRLSPDEQQLLLKKHREFMMLPDAAKSQLRNQFDQTRNPAVGAAGMPDSAMPPALSMPPLPVLPPLSTTPSAGALTLPTH